MTGSDVPQFELVATLLSLCMVMCLKIAGLYYRLYNRRFSMTLPDLMSDRERPEGRRFRPKGNGEEIKF